MSLTVAELAEHAGLRPDTVRCYERAGLIAPPARSRSGYRQYEDGVIERLRFIKGAQRMGLRLRQIRELLEIRDRGLCPCGHTQAMLAERIAELDREVRELRALRTELARLREQLPPAAECPADAGPWPCERAFVQAGGDRH